MPLFEDTSPDAEAFLIEGLRKMSPADKLEQVRQLSLSVQQIALLRIREEYPHESPEQWRLRLASLWLDRDVMREVFGWDPESA